MEFGRLPEDQGEGEFLTGSVISRHDHFDGGYTLRVRSAVTSRIWVVIYDEAGNMVHAALETA